MRFLVLIPLLFAWISFVGCGEPTDDREDCTQGEFFDESTEQCDVCPAVLEPDCAPGCDFTIARDENGCPEAICNTECTNTCQRGTFYSEDSLQCEICPGGLPREVETCQGLPCSCEPVTPTDSCADMYCGNCTSPSDGWTVDATGRCVFEQ